MHYLIILLGLIGSTYSSCSLEPVEGFTDEDFLGNWFLLAQSDIRVPHYPIMACVEMYGFKKGPSYKFTGTGIDVQTNQKIANWSATGIIKDKPGNFVFSVDKWKYSLTAIGKSAKGVLLYSCEFPPFKDQRYTWIFYRDVNANFETLPADEKTEILKSLSDNGIELSSMEIHENSNCKKHSK